MRLHRAGVRVPGRDVDLLAMAHPLHSFVRLRKPVGSRERVVEVSALLTAVTRVPSPRAPGSF
jgi:hypothetical protein